MFSTMADRISLPSIDSILPGSILPEPLAPSSPQSPIQPAMASNKSSSSSSSSSSPSPSQGSQKRSAEDDISELIRKAKASRYAQPLTPTQRLLCNPDALSALEEELSCSICATIYHHPVTCLDCQHIFCGSCIVQWFDRSDKCPSCRQKVRVVEDNLSLSSLANILLKAHPEIGRSIEELTELDELYQPGQEVEINQVCSDDDDDDDDLRQEYDDDLSDGSLNSEDPPIWHPCPCCTTPNIYGFSCPEPIPAPNPGTGAGRRQNELTYMSHASCSSCYSSIPIGLGEGWECSGCDERWCGNLFTCSQQQAWIKPALEQAWDVEPDSHFARAGIRPRSDGNQTERHNFDVWQTEKGLSWPQIGARLVQYMLEEKGGISIDRRTLVGSDYVCQRCIREACSDIFMEWWIWERESTGYVDNRVRCWYGRFCHTQHTDPSHAERLNHVCEPTPPHLRIDNAPRRVSTSDLAPVTTPQPPPPAPPAEGSGGAQHA